MAKTKFNTSFFLPILDLVVFIVLLGGAGMYWFNTRGVEQIDESSAAVAVADAENRAQISVKEQAILEALEEKEQTIIDKNVRIMQTEMIDNQILVEHERIQQGELRARELTDQFSTARLEIEDTENQHRSKRAEILERREEISELDQSVGTLRTEVADSLGFRNQIQTNIASLTRERERDPISIFPPGAAVASIVEIESEDRIYGVSLSAVIKQFGEVNVGLSGNLGLNSESESSVREAGFFANVPLAFRRASVDFETGLASIRNERGDDDFSAFAGATLRYAPLRKERLFLLAGTKYRDSDVSLRFGVGFGRR